METRGVSLYPPRPSQRLLPGIKTFTLPGACRVTSASGNMSSGYISYRRPDKEIRPSGNYASQRSSISRFDLKLNTALVNQQLPTAILMPPNANVMRIVGRAQPEDPILTNSELPVPGRNPDGEPPVDPNVPPSEQTDPRRYPRYEGARLRPARQGGNKLVQVAPGVFA